MDTGGYEGQSPGLHVRPAPPPKQPSKAWKVLKWFLVLGLAAICGVSVIFNMLLSAGAASVGASGRQVVEEHVSGPSGMRANSKVAVVTVDDLIIGSEWTGTAAWILAQLDCAAEDEKVKAVILDVDSPGGGITACDVIYGRIRELQAQGITIVVLMRNIAASGGYYISAPADYIVAQPTTLTGSIGVIISTYNVEGLFDKIGIEAVVFKSGDKKDMLSPYRPISEEERRALQEITDEMFDRFREVVMKGRNLTEEEMDAAADGSVFTASRALDLNLIDEIGYFDDARKVALQAAGAKAEVVRYSEPPSLADVLFAKGPSPLSRVEERLAALAETLQPGFYYLWPGP